MIEVVRELTKEFRLVTDDSYYSKNTSDPIVYPYLTFKADVEELHNGIDGFYVDVDITDSNSRYVNLFTLEKQLKAHLKNKNTLLDSLFIRYSFLRSNEIDMLDDLIKRRSLQFYCKVYWRE